MSDNGNRVIEYMGLAETEKHVLIVSVNNKDEAKSICKYVADMLDIHCEYKGREKLPQIDHSLYWDRREEDDEIT